MIRTGLYTCFFVFILLDGNGVMPHDFDLSCLLVYLTPHSIESPRRHLHTYLVWMETKY